jgi:hypothetical protein
MIVTDLHRSLIAAMLLLFSCGIYAEPQQLTYLVLADTVEPLMITTDKDPMSGGIVTDVVREIFRDPSYIVNPLVVPWQRMSLERRNRDNWIMYGSPSQCKPGSGCVFSVNQVVQFEHVVVTLKTNQLKLPKVEDLFGKRLLLVENFHYPGLDQYLKTPTDVQGSGQISDLRSFTPASALKMLRHQRGDAFVDWRLRVLYNLQEAGLTLNEVRLDDFSQVIPTQGIHLFYSDNLPAETGRFINKRLAGMTKDGTLSRIVQSYVSPP